MVECSEEEYNVIFASVGLSSPDRIKNFCDGYKTIIPSTRTVRDTYGSLKDNAKREGMEVL